MGRKKKPVWYPQVQNLLSDLEDVEVMPIGEDGAQVTIHNCEDTYLFITTFPSDGTLDQLRDSIDDMLEDLDDHECPEEED